jgi:hypothetical protein
VGLVLTELHPVPQPRRARRTVREKGWRESQGDTQLSVLGER